MFILKCNSNLISLGQLHKSGIIFNNLLIAIIWIRKRKIIAKAKKKQNLFILDIVFTEKIMITIKTTLIIIEKNCLIYLLSSNKWVKLWYKGLSHSSNVHILWVSKLIVKSDLQNEIYNLSKIYNNFKAFKDFKNEKNSISPYIKSLLIQKSAQKSIYINDINQILW